MSVIVKGMKMPKDCPMCPMSHWTKASDEFTGCDVVSGKRYEMSKSKEYRESVTRPGWCPLVELPKNHGSLIDADELEKKCRLEIALLKLKMIKEEPIIFEAEGERNENT